MHFTASPGDKIGERNGIPLQYSCLGNPMDRDAWQATVHEVTKSWTQLSDWAHTYIRDKENSEWKFLQRHHDVPLLDMEFIEYNETLFLCFLNNLKNRLLGCWRKQAYMKESGSSPRLSPFLLPQPRGASLLEIEPIPYDMVPCTVALRYCKNSSSSWPFPRNITAHTFFIFSLFKLFILPLYTMMYYFIIMYYIIMPLL